MQEVSLHDGGRLQWQFPIARAGAVSAAAACDTLAQSPPLFANHVAPVAQLDRASGYEPEGREFESLRARHSNPHNV